MKDVPMICMEDSYAHDGYKVIIRQLMIEKKGNEFLEKLFFPEGTHFVNVNSLKRSEISNNYSHLITFNTNYLKVIVLTFKFFNVVFAKILTYFRHMEFITVAKLHRNLFIIMLGN